MSEQEPSLIPDNNAEIESHAMGQDSIEGEEGLDEVLLPGTIVTQRDSGDQYRIVGVSTNPYNNVEAVALEYAGNDPIKSQRKMNLNAERFKNKLTKEKSDPEKTWFLTGREAESYPDTGDYSQEVPPSPGLSAEDNQMEYPKRNELLTGYTGPAIRMGGNSDTQPITITGLAAEHEGKRYFAIEGSDTAIPEDEILLAQDIHERPGASGGQEQQSSEQSSSELSAESPQPAAQPTNGEAAQQPLTEADIEQEVQDYLKKNLELFDTSTESRETLVNARTHLAEASVKMRRGNLVFSKNKRQQRYENALAEYQEARRQFISEYFEGAAAPEPYREPLITELHARESGALMGEEVNAYLKKENSDYKQFLEWYHGLSKGKQIAMGLGAGAVVSVLGGFAAGGVAAGGILGARAGRGYISREARRTQKRELTQKQQEATFYHFNQDTQNRMFSTIHAVNRHEKGVSDQDMINMGNIQPREILEENKEHYRSALDDAEIDAKQKRKSLIGATVGVVAVGGAGFIAEHVSDWHGVLRGGQESAGIDALEDRVEGLESELEDAQEENQELQEENQQLQEQLEDTQDTQNGDAESEPGAAEPEVSEQAQYLYGELAGEKVNIHIPEGSSVWDEMESVVDKEMRHPVGHSEKQRIVGNILNAMENEYPGRDFDHVHPGESFSVTLPH